MSEYPIHEIIFDNSGMAVIVIEENSRISMVNKMFENLSGYTKEEVEGRLDWTHFVVDDELPRLKAYRESRLKDPSSAPEAYEFRFKDRDGTIKHVLINISFLPETRQTIASLQDNTEQYSVQDSLKHRLSFEELISSTSRSFINVGSDSIDDEIVRVLGDIGEIAAADRCYVFILEPDGVHFSNTHEWCAAGIEPQKDTLQQQSVIDAGWTFSKLLQNEIIYLPTMDALPDEAAFERSSFERQDIKSAILVPLFYNNHLRGFLGLDSVKDTRSWHDQDFIMLRTAGDIIINAYERMRTDQKLENSERKYRDFVNFMPQVVFETDLQGRITFVNQQAYLLFEYQEGDLEKRINISSAIAEKDWDRMKRNFGRVLQGANSDGDEYTAVTKGGREFPILVYATPVYLEGELTGVRGIIIDMTVRKMLEDQLQQSQKMEALGRLAGGIAHDFNNMLTSIMGFCSLLKLNESMNEEYNDTIENIVTIAKSGANLTRQLLAFSRKEIISPKSLSVNRVVEKSLKMLKRLMYDNIRVTTDLAEDLRPIKADPGQIEQVVMNLVLNSQDALPDGGNICILTGNVPADVAVDVPGQQLEARDYVLLEVLDNGYGMTEEVRNKVLEPFFTTKSLGQGTGLGLSTVYGIAVQNNGALAIDSAPNEGTRIGLYFPAI